jgi:hypothetical protein
MTDKEKKPSRQKAYTLLVEVGRKEDDGLPKGATGGALMIYASGVDVTGYGTLEERLAEGHDISDDEIALMQRALDENSVVVAQMTPFFGDKPRDL